jgi:hypothetical protein
VITTERLIILRTLLRAAKRGGAKDEHLAVLQELIDALTPPERNVQRIAAAMYFQKHKKFSRDMAAHHALRLYPPDPGEKLLAVTVARSHWNPEKHPEWFEAAEHQLAMWELLGDEPRVP